MKRTLSLTLSAAVALTTASAWLSGCGDSADQKLVDRHRDETVAAMRAMLASRPPQRDASPTTMQPCPSGSISATATIPLVFAGDLELIVAGEPRSGDWAWSMSSLSAQEISNLVPYEKAGSAGTFSWARAIKFLRAHDHVGVVFEDGASMPSIEGHDDGSGTRQFTPGYIHATLALVDRKSGRALCWKRIEGRSSSDLRSFRGTNAIMDLYSDVVQALVTAANAAAKELAL